MAGHATAARARARADKKTPVCMVCGSACTVECIDASGRAYKGCPQCTVVARAPGTPPFDGPAPLDDQQRGRLAAMLRARGRLSDARGYLKGAPSLPAIAAAVAAIAEALEIAIRDLEEHGHVKVPGFIPEQKP